jgi:hypothetical protein
MAQTLHKLGQMAQLIQGMVVEAGMWSGQAGLAAPASSSSAMQYDHD